MRVAHIITRMIIGGAQENTLLNCIDLMRIYGDEVLLITGPTVGPEGSLMPRVEQAQIPVSFQRNLLRAILPHRDARALSDLKKTLKSFRPDVVHTHSAKGGILGRLAAHAVGTPAIVHTVHGAPFHPFQPWAVRQLYRRCERYAAKRCHRMISVADAMTDLMVEANVAPREKFVTIYSGMEVTPYLAADENRQAARAELNYSPEHIVIGKIARLFHLKGHQYVIEAARHVANQNPHVRFLFIGDGVLREQLMEQIAAAGLSDIFQFTGLVEPERIPFLLSATDALVHASLREGLARALPQALLSARPAISYDVDGAREVIINDETGFLLPPKDVQGLAEAIVKLADDEGLRRRLGGQGRGRFLEQFRHETMTRRIREVYQEVLGKENPRREVAGLS